MQLNGKNKSYTPHFLYYSVKCVPSINILSSGRYWHFSMLTLNIRVWRVIKQLNNATFGALSRDETTWRKPCHTTADASKSSSFSIANSTSSTPRQLQLIYHLNWNLPLLGWKQLTAVRTASQIPRLPSAPKKTSKWKIHLQRYARDVRGCRIFKLLWIYFLHGFDENNPPRSQIWPNLAWVSRSGSWRCWVCAGFAHCSMVWLSETLLSPQQIGNLTTKSTLNTETAAK